MIQLEGKLVQLRCAMCNKSAVIASAEDATEFAFRHDHHSGYSMIVRIESPRDLAGHLTEIVPVLERREQ